MKKIAVCLLVMVCVCGLVRSPALAAEPREAWVLKDSYSQTFLCEPGPLCGSPSMKFSSSSADITWSVAQSDCTANYAASGSWSPLPDEITPGDTVSLSLSAQVSQTTSCEAAWNAKTDTSLAFAKTDADGQVGNLQYVGQASAGGLIERGKAYTNQQDATFTAPPGVTGEELQLRLDVGLGALPSGYIVYVYEYQAAGMPDVAVPAAAIPEESDPCGVRLAELGDRSLPFVPVALARDSGARFADFSGEVTVAPGSDPKAEEPADMSMVLETGSIVKTESESYAIISFADMSTFCMKPFTTVIIDTPPEKESRLSLLAGKVWLNVKKMVQDGTMNVTMNQAVAGIKGTVLVVEETGTESILKVVSGKVDLTSLADGSRLTLAEGETARGTAGGLSEISSFDVAAEKTDWQMFAEVLPSGALEKNSRAIFYWILAAVVAAGAVAGAVALRKKTKRS